MSTPANDWPYDADRNDPLAALRIPVVNTIRPSKAYLVALCINENPDWEAERGLRPNDLEVEQIRSLIAYHRSGWYTPTWLAREMDSKPFDLDDMGPNVTLIKRGEGDWAFRHSTWDRGPALAPALHEEGEVPLDLPGLLDRMAHGNSKWEQWKADHPEVFGQPGRCGDAR